MRAWLLASCVLCSLATRATAQDVRVSEIPNLGWTPILIGVTAVGLTLLIDQPIAQEVAGHTTRGSQATARALGRFGEVGVVAPVVGALAFAGVLGKRPEMTRTAGRVVGSLVLVNLIVQPAKRLFGRSRPNESGANDAFVLSPFSGHTAFPSGHTATAFALATTLGDASGSPVAKAGLYLLATGTAWGRVTESRHWVSDVTAGAAIGILSSKFASGRIRLLGMSAPRILIGPGAAGVSMSYPLPVVR